MVDGKTAKRVWFSGLAVGLAAGTAMASFALVTSALRGIGFWTPMKLYAVLAVGPAALQMGAASSLLGLGIHFFFSAMLGVVFAFIAQREMTGLSATIAGTVFGAAVYGLTAYIVLPVVNPFLYATIHTGWFVVYMLVFGATLGLLVPTRRRLARLPSSLAFRTQRV